MEAVIFLAVWILGVYFIKIKMELNAYRKKANAHKDIYVPSFSEMMRFNHWSLNLYRYILAQAAEYKANVNYKKLYSSIKKEQQGVPVLAWSSVQDQSRGSLNFREEQETEYRSVA